ncbi:MAG TPA: VWA domain-containing protein, partial [Vicinamibacterales bacterium]|nr:VWA domain-containing protein [Vicinamibacterales bacterium]
MNDERLASRSAIAAAVVAAAMAALDAGQPPTFRSAINLVEVDALAVDRSGEVVSDLRQDEFEVLEDGRPQKIASFQFVNIPLPSAGERPAARHAGDDVYANDDRALGRLLVLVLDDLHIAPFRAEAVRGLAKRFIDRMGANDLMAIVSTSGDRKASQEFTKDRAALESAVGRFTPSKDAVNENNPDASHGFAAQKSVSMLKTLGDVAGHLSGVQHRRKTVLFVSEGVDLELMPGMDDPRDVAANALSSSTSRDAAKGSGTDEDFGFLARTALESLLRAAERGNVAIYPLDPRALEEGLPVVANDFLRTIAANTGGQAVVATNQMTAGLDRIIRESSSYYLIGYESPSGGDGRFHRLTVRVRRPDVDVRARQGFVAPDAKKLAKSKPVTPLDESLSAPAQNPGFAIRGVAAPFPSPTHHGAVVAVAAEISGDVLARAAGTPSLELAVLAVDSNGKGRAIDREQLKFPGFRPSAGESWIRIVSRLDVKDAGHYQIRLVAQPGGLETAGSVFYDVDVPDFDGTPLTMSGIVVGPPNRGGGSARIARMREIAAVIPVATRSF